MVPGRTLHRVAKVLLPSHVCEQVVDAQLADFQHEWASAHSFARQTLVLARGYSAFLWSCALCVVDMRGQSAVGDGRALIRVLGISFVAASATIAAMVISFSHFPFLIHASSETLVAVRWARVASVASSVPLAVPFGFMLG